MTAPSTALDRALAQARRPLAFVGLFSLVANLLMLTLPLYTLQVFDRVITGRSEATLVALTAIALFALVV